MSAASDQSGLRLQHMGDCTYALEGELDMATAPVLEASFAEVRGPIRFDLGALNFLDSSGLRALIRLYQRCEADGCSFHIVGCSPPVERILRMVDVYDALTLSPANPIPTA